MADKAPSPPRNPDVQEIVEKLLKLQAEENKKKLRRLVVLVRVFFTYETE